MRRRGQSIRLGYDDNVIIPVTSEDNIIFALDTEKGTYKREYYHPEMTQGRISKQEIDDFLKGIDAFTEPVFAADMVDCSRWVRKNICWIIWSVILSFALGIILGILVSGFFLLILPLSFVLFFVFVCVFMTANTIGSAVTAREVEKLHEKIRPYVQSKNPQFVGRGYHWVVPGQCPYWIELWRGQNAGIEVMNMDAQYGIPVNQESTYSALNNHYSPNNISP